MARLKKQVLADTNTDNLLTKFKEIVPMEQVSSKIKDLYSLWVKATYGEENNMDYFSEWFDDYYDSILPDCINNAKEDEEFYEKYNNLTGEEINELNTQINDFIVSNKDTIEQNINQSSDNNSELPLDNPEASDIYNTNEYDADTDDFTLSDSESTDGDQTESSDDTENSDTDNDDTNDDDMVDFNLDDLSSDEDATQSDDTENSDTDNEEAQSDDDLFTLNDEDTSNDANEAQKEETNLTIQ